MRRTLGNHDQHGDERNTPDNKSDEGTIGAPESTMIVRAYLAALGGVMGRVRWRRVRLTLVPWLLALVLLAGPNSPLALANPRPAASSQGANSAPRGTSGTPNTLASYVQQLRARQAQPRKIAQASAGGQVVKPGSITTFGPIGRPSPHAAKPGSLALDPSRAATFLSGDGALEIDVPAGAVTSQDVAAAGGSLALQVSQVASPAGSSAGGSGELSFGTYLFQVVTAQGTLAPQGLRAPITIRYHYGTRELGVNLSHAFFVLNGAARSHLTLAPTAPASAAATPTAQAKATTQASPTTQATATAQLTPTPKATPTPDATASPKATAAPSSPGADRSTSTAPAISAAAATPRPTPVPTPAPTTSPATPATRGPGARFAVTQDAAQHTLSAIVSLKTAANTGSFGTFGSVATFGKPDPFAVDLNAGGLTSSLPIDVPSGPGGLTPNVALSYSSASVSEQHNPQGAASWVGEGWNLNLGEISWAEHDVTANCLSTCGYTFEDSWQLSDPFGTSAELIPPNINVTTYYDDTPYPITNTPIQWHTAANRTPKCIATPVR